MECFCYLRNVPDLLADGQTLYERRSNSPFDGPIVPFGAEVTICPISSKHLGRVHRSVPQSFTEYSLDTH